MVQPTQEEPPRLLVGAPLLALHICDLFGRALRFYRIRCGDDEEEEQSAHRRVDGVLLLAQGGQPAFLVSSRLLCLNQAAAAMRVIEVGVMRPGARVSSAPLPLLCDQFDHSLFCCCSRARPVALTSAACQECSTVTNDASNARDDPRASVYILVSEQTRAQRGQL